MIVTVTITYTENRMPCIDNIIADIERAPRKSLFDAEGNLFSEG